MSAGMNKKLSKSKSISSYPQRGRNKVKKKPKDDRKLISLQFTENWIENEKYKFYKSILDDVAVNEHDNDSNSSCNSELKPLLFALQT